VDGCLTPGEAGDWNWEALKTIRDLNRWARQGEPVPAITLCTGRQEPYVEVLMQAIGGYLPCIYENGCGLYFPEGYRFLEHPSITLPSHEALAAAKATLYRQVVVPGLGYFQPGKEASLTLYPLPGTGVQRLYQVVADVLAPHDGALTIQASVSCVDVTPIGIDKGQGVRWLSEQTDIPLALMGGIGDSTSDLKFLNLVGRSAAPANATLEVKAAVKYVSPYADGSGVVDILRHWLIGKIDNRGVIAQPPAGLAGL
jgi:hydroxymethylpyrimidine pyrophosphatase-like HAD family hydrolase